ncbi:hypothetical protein G6683_04940 [Polynucleobacter paneuropaeus]|nr:hypothetical protein [Polynucleobacter paneuropaeus]
MNNLSLLFASTIAEEPIKLPGLNNNCLGHLYDRFVSLIKAQVARSNRAGQAKHPFPPSDCPVLVNREDGNLPLLPHNLVQSIDCSN